MKKIVLIFSLLICCVSLTAQQSNRRKSRNIDQTEETGKKDVLRKEDSSPKIPKKGNKFNSPTTREIVKGSFKNDSAYYANVVKKHGWFVGVGKRMTLEQANHLSCYYKLSKNNQAGNWTLMEAYNGYGNLITYHSIASYLVNQGDENDKSANKEWRKKLQTICKWEFIADPSGKEVLQERALDKEGNIIFIYSPVKVGENTYTGCYTDGWGMPIFLRTDSLGNHAGQANFVQITRDENGYEVLHAYTDIGGHPQKNKDGAYMTKKAYDKEGHQIMEASLNIVGDKMIDDYGNCGWEHYYHPTYNESYYYDADWKRIKMPKTEKNNDENVYGHRHFPDEFGRDTLVMYIDQDGKPDVNEAGINAIRTQYNEHGLWTHMRWYDLNGRLYADESGIAQIYYKFNSDGLTTEVGYQDAKGNYVNGPSGWCKQYNTYDENGNWVYEIEYAAISTGALSKRYDYKSDGKGNETRKWYGENKQRIDSVDDKGRNVLIAWYDLKRKPIDNNGFHKYIAIYDDEHNTETEIWLDKDGNATNNGNAYYTKYITNVDSVQHTISYYQYIHNLPFCAWQQQFDQTHTMTIAQWDITPYGEHARAGWWNNLHYTCQVDYTMYGEFRTFVGKNEFNEPSYLVSLENDGAVYYFSDWDNGGTRYYDENGILIPSDKMEVFKENRPKAFCIEVTDTSIAYPLGLRNGDIILSYGNWTTSENLRTNIDYFYWETIQKADKKKQITLLRHHPDSNSSEIVRYDLPKGKTSDLGFYPHKIYYTQKEQNRLWNTCANNKIKLTKSKLPKRDTTVLMAVPIKGKFETTYLYHFPKYNIKDPGIVLNSKGNDTWNMEESTMKWDGATMFIPEGSELYFTQDMTTIRTIQKEISGDGGMRFVPINVSMKVYENLLQCYTSQNTNETNTNNSVQSSKTGNAKQSSSKKQGEGKNASKKKR